MKKKTTAQISDFQPASRPHQTLHSLPFFALLAFFIVSVLLCFFFLCSLLPRAWSTGKKATAITESLSLSGCWPYTKLTDLHSRLLLALLFSHWRVAKMFCCLILDFGEILSLSSI